LELKKSWSDLVPTMRILCLSEVHDETSMWYHYAGKYTGAVIELAVDDRIDSALLLARPVMYADEVPVAARLETWVDTTLFSPPSAYWKLFVELQYAKRTSWAYEREWRVATYARPGDAGTFADYDILPQEVRAVYLGSKCSAEDKQEILALVNYSFPNASIFQAEPDSMAGRFKFATL
jgi:hypothetical protein